MRMFITVALIVAALAPARADDKPQPLTDRPVPIVKLTSTEGWRLSAVAGMDVEGETLVLVIEGDVINAGDRERPSPAIRLALSDKEGRELYHWTVQADQDRVRPGDWSPYRARLESPPRDAYSVEIRTVDR